MIHAGWQRAILCSPSGVDVLGDTFIRIEGVNRAYKEQDRGEISRQHGHNHGAAPVESKQTWWAKSSIFHGVPEQRGTAVHSATLVHGLCQQNNNP